MNNAMPGRFVILYHDSPRGDHWDLMFENEESLTTWALPPQTPGEAFVCPAEPLPDHRLAYLEYEGPVSGNRGSVRQVDAGNFEASGANRYRLSGRFFKGILTVEKITDTEDQLQFIPFQSTYS